MSDHTYSRAKLNGEWDVSTSIAAEVEAVLPGKTFRLAMATTQVTFAFDAALGPGEVSTLDQVVTDHKAAAGARALAVVKHSKSNEIDARTAQLIEVGFEFPPSSGKIFSLSKEFQLMLTGLNQERTAPEVTYPVDWNTKDDSDKLSLVDADMVRSFYMTAVGTVRAHRDSGTALKDQVRAATTIAEVEAVEDTR